MIFSVSREGNHREKLHPVEIDAAPLGLRRTCIMLMECLTVLLMQLDPVSICKIIKEDVKIRAKAVADEWKLKLDTLYLDVSNGNSLEAQAFLQLLDTFSIAAVWSGAIPAYTDDYARAVH
ncbi:hypothetical protein Droror1_Dr00020249, partial [Drosera rotundifolia]